MKKQLLTLIVVAVMMLSVAQATPTVQNVKVQQRYPWNGLVDIDYEIVSDKPAETDFWVYFTAKDNDLNASIAPRTLSGDGAAGAPVKKGKRRITWDMGADMPKFHTSALSVSVHASSAMPYMVIDLSGGTEAATYPVRYSATPPNLDDDTCRTTELWLKFIQPGTFMMGSPTDEPNRSSNETLHEVTLTQPYYMGIFEVTQKQWQLVMGATPSSYKGDVRPVGNVSYNMIRGAVNGAGWPTHGQVDADSFMGILRTKTSVVVDLPTEAQWEYACRAGTSSSLNNGKSHTDVTNMAEVGRYYGNRFDGKGGYSEHTKVGSYLPNAWGLYDMHGNVLELCLDWGTSYTGWRMVRGGDWYYSASHCRAAFRSDSNGPTAGNHYHDFRNVPTGLRACVLPMVVQ